MQNNRVKLKTKIFSLASCSFTLFVLSFTLVHAQDITTGLVGHWKLDEGSGTTATDSSGNNNTGTLTNGPTWTAGKISNALQLDGVNDYVNAGNPASLNLSSSFTLSAWIYPAALSGDRDIITKVGSGADYYLQTTNNQLQVGFAAAGNWYSHITTSASLPLNAWTHVSGVFDDAANILTIYVNGIQQGTQSVAASRTSGTDPVHIGMGWSNQTWNGRIDEARIYNRALTSADIQTLYAYTGGPPDTQAPTTPTNLSATAISSSQINLSWSASTDNVGVIGYRVERCSGSGCTNFTQIATPPPAGGTNSFNDTGLSANTTYRYQVRAVDGSNNLSPYSSIVSATTQAPPPPDTQAPTAPTNLSATAQSSTQINLSWTASTDNVGVTGYRVERCTGSTCTTFSQISTPSTNSYNDTGLTANTTYRYQVRAVDAANNLSLYSSIVNATTQTAPPSGNPTITSVSGTLSGGNVITVSGTNFGTGDTSPLLWDDFESGTNGASLPPNPKIGTWAIQNGGPLYTNGTRHAGSLSAMSDYPSGNGFANIEWSPLSHSAGVKYYQSYWFRYNSPAGGNGQTKHTQLWGSYRIGDYNPGVMTGGLAGDWWASYIALENSGGYQQTNYPQTPSRNQWHLFEMILQQSDANVANGRVTIKVDGQNVFDQNPVKTRELAGQGWDFTTFFDGMTNWGSAVQTWIDDVYFNDSWVRVELGNASTYVGSTVREIQIPASWSASSLSFTANPGSFASGQTAYLYVTDQNDNVNANGYPVTIGGGSSDTQAPSTPTNLSATAQSSTQINLSWTASTDNIGVIGYQVERCTGSTCTTFTQISTPSTNSYNDTGLTANTTYRYRVRAVDAAGNLSGYSSIVNATTQSTPTGGSYTRVFYDGWESGNTNLWGSDGSRNKCTSVTSALDGGTPKSGSRMALCNWNGVVAWNDPAAYSTLVLNSWNYSNEFLIRLWVRADTDVDNKFGSKWFRLYNSSNSYYWDGQMEQSGGPIFSTLETYERASYGSAQVGDRQWHKVEMYVKQGNGSIFRLWVDGSLQHEETGFSTSLAKWYPMYFMSNWSNNGPEWDHDANNHIYWDDVEIYSDSTSGTAATGNLSDGTITTGGTPPPSTLVGDLNGDRTVNGTDWSLMSAVWFTASQPSDINIDFSLLNRNWGVSI